MVLLAFGLALADVRITAFYPAPYGRHNTLTIRGDLTTGRSTPAYKHSTVTLNGNATLDAGSLFVREELTAGGMLRVAGPVNRFGICMHWTTIGLGTSYIADRDLQVNGDVLATRFFNCSGCDAPISDAASLGISSDGSWGEIVKKRNDESTWGIFNTQYNMDFSGSPYIFLNRYSGGNVGIGTVNPQAKLQVGDIASGLTAVGNPGWFQTFSSRSYKKDISPLAAPDYAELLSKLKTLEVVRYRYKHEPAARARRIGVIAEDAPQELLTPDRHTVSTADAIGFLLATVKGMRANNERLKREIAALEQEVAVFEEARSE